MKNEELKTFIDDCKIADDIHLFKPCIVKLADCLEELLRLREFVDKVAEPTFNTFEIFEEAKQLKEERW